MNPDLLSDWLKYINSNRPNEGEFGLDRLHSIFTEIVKKPLAQKTILVGGTNGKGTTVEYLQSFLISAGYSVGVYTSPHLIEFNERIRINNIPVDDEKIIRSFKLIDNLKQETRLTYFDYATLAAFDIFSQEELDFAILEIGIGGKYDPVNLINSEVSVITNIELDHEKWLGSSLEEIGSQKAAILKPGKVAILGSENMPKSVTRQAKEICSSIYQLNKDFKVCKEDSSWSYNFSDFNFLLETIPYGNLNIDSASCAITAYKLLCEEKIDFRESMEGTFLKGRCDVKDNFILDVSHNPASIKHLVSFLDTNYKNKSFNAIFATMSEKDNLSIIKEISHLISEWNICSIEDSRFDANSLKLLTQSLTDKTVNIVDTVYSAVERGYHKGTPQIVFGSFITVSEAYKALEKINIKNREIN